MNKKILFLIALLILVVGVLTACGENKPTEQNASGNTVVEEKEKDKTKTVDDTDPYKANIPNEIIEFYKEKVDAIEKEYKDSQTQLINENPDMDIASLTNLKYDLIFLDDDNTPELVVTEEGIRTALYTYDAGQVIFTMKDTSDEEFGWPFGTAGNAGYEYIPKGNIIRNYASEYAGMIRHYIYNYLDKTDFQLKNKYEEGLFEVHFEDKNDNGIVDEGENIEKYFEEPIYHYGEKIITEEEFNNYLIDGDYEEMAGTKTYAKMIEALDSLINEK